MKGAKRNDLALIGVLVLSAIGLLYGWRLFWFLTDDAHISFRYISNSILGYGYVWNPPPFKPVEGYTNFLWIILLEVLWRVLRIAPPESSTYIALLFSYGTLLVSTAFVLNMQLRPCLTSHRVLFVAVILFGILTNRTFLAWTSSGLETAMFNFLVILWVYLCVYTYRIDSRRLAIISGVTACIALTRPDGMLFAATLATALVVTRISNRHLLPLRSLTGLAPLLLIPIHLLWRKNMYGEWLPNTYYAKITSSWPESGIKYLSSFVLEYSLWFFTIFFIIFCWSKLSDRIFFKKKIKIIGDNSFTSDDGIVRKKINYIFQFIATSTLFIHIIYYTFIVGGDYFEFRVYSDIVPLIFISFIWVINSLKYNIYTSISILTLFIFLSWPVQWANWNLARKISTVPIGSHIVVEISDIFPSWLQWYANIYDRQQRWLIDHFACLRHQEHKNFYFYLKQVSPAREEGLQLPSQDFPVLAVTAPGVFGWSMPRVNIIDKLGLNDYVIARNPVNKYTIRLMAHERTAPAGYLECFSPNVEPDPLTKKPIILRRTKKLTENDIVNCEKTWADKVAGATHELF